MGVASVLFRDENGSRNIVGSLEELNNLHLSRRPRKAL